MVPLETAGNNGAELVDDCTGKQVLDDEPSISALAFNDGVVKTSYDWAFRGWECQSRGGWVEVIGRDVTDFTFTVRPQSMINEESLGQLA